jgi:phosphopantetheinyl transferase
MGMELFWARIEPGQTGHEAAWALLERSYGAPLPEVARTDRGKPYFLHSALHFSLSHTGQHVFCALSDRPVGVDGEETCRLVRPELAEKILSAGELSRYHRAEDKNAALLKLWVLKEAQAKCTGEGLRGYPKNTDFSPEDPRIREIDGCYVAVIEQLEEDG